LKEIAFVVRRKRKDLAAKKTSLVVESATKRRIAAIIIVKPFVMMVPVKSVLTLLRKCKHAAVVE